MHLALSNGQMLKNTPQTLRYPLLFCLFLALLLALPVSNCFARSEQDVKAAYLYNFIKFIAWPETHTDQNLRLCLLGDDSINDKLTLLDQRPIRGKPLQVEAISTTSNLLECTVLFIGHSESKFLPDILEEVSESPVLTISSMDNFANDGGMIGFITHGNIIRFDINLKQASNTQLSISSKLLELANKVVR